MRKLYSFFVLLLYLSTAVAQQWPKCILAGDYPDPSVMREGNDFLYDTLSIRLSAGIPYMAFQRLDELAPCG